MNITGVPIILQSVINRTYEMERVKQDNQISETIRQKKVMYGKNDKRRKTI